MLRTTSVWLTGVRSCKQMGVAWQRNMVKEAAYGTARAASTAWQGRPGRQREVGAQARTYGATLLQPSVSRERNVPPSTRLGAALALGETRGRGNAWVRAVAVAGGGGGRRRAAAVGAGGSCRALDGRPTNRLTLLGAAEAPLPLLGRQGGGFGGFRRGQER